MFGLPSLSKLLVLAAVVLVVWYGFKIVNRLDNARKSEAKLRAYERQKEEESRQARGEVEEMKACTKCGAYVPASNPANCGRSDCPY